MFWQNISALAFKDPLHACLYSETMPQGKSGMLAQAEEDGFTHLKQRGMSAPDSWLNFRCTLSSCLVRISSWGMIAAELSLSKLSLRLLSKETRCTYLGSQWCVLFLLRFRVIVWTLKDTGANCYEDVSEFSSPLQRHSLPQTTSPSKQLFTLMWWPRIWIDAHTWCIPSQHTRNKASGAKLHSPEPQTTIKWLGRITRCALPSAFAISSEFFR